MHHWLLALAVWSSVGGATDRAAARKADRAYEEARRSYYALKDDPKRRQFRHQWLSVADRFEGVASSYPGSDRAPEALYTSAELLADLARISRAEQDLSRAVEDYRQVLEKHPRHRLADDAALALGRILAQRLGKPEEAAELLGRALKKLPRGDCTAEIRALHGRLAGHLPRTAPAAAAAPAPAPPPSTPPPSAKAPAAPPAPVAVAVSKLKPGHGQEITIAEQLGLKVRRVVIDAGHGGHDSGAVGRRGTLEKDVALAISLKLGEALRKEGLEVTYTRQDDAYLGLEQRAQLANDARGDLFISIHCNSAPSSKLRGVETYTLNIASDRYSIRLAARENSSSEKGISDLQFILADLATKANTEESTRLAQRVQRSLATELSQKYRGVRDLGHKQALFYVLLGVRMPAILVETSFLSHPEEEKRLASPEYQADVAAAIAAGVQDFLGNRGRLARVD
jgi:N-acetylmuramoyl-L-alanine amidase